MEKPTINLAAMANALQIDKGSLKYFLGITLDAVCPAQNFDDAFKAFIVAVDGKTDMGIAALLKMQEFFPQKLETLFFDAVEFEELWDHLHTNEICLIATPTMLKKWTNACTTMKEALKAFKAANTTETKRVAIEKIIFLADSTEKDELLDAMQKVEGACDTAGEFELFGQLVKKAARFFEKAAVTA